MEWEQEQLRRGGHKTPDSVGPSAFKVKQTYKPALSKAFNLVAIIFFTHGFFF